MIRMLTFVLLIALTATPAAARPITPHACYETTALCVVQVGTWCYATDAPRVLSYVQAGAQVQTTGRVIADRSFVWVELVLGEARCWLPWVE